MAAKKVDTASESILNDNKIKSKSIVQLRNRSFNFQKNT